MLLNYGGTPAKALPGEIVGHDGSSGVGVLPFDVQAGVEPASALAVPTNGQSLGRAIDVIGSLALIVLLLPVMVLIALLIWLQDGGAPIFVHRRIGRYGQLFPCLKFRSMVRDSQARLAHLLATDPEARAEWRRDHKLRNDPRVTPLGNFLRASSLDELPQLFNVLAGSMSLVGPRPIVAEEVPRYGRYYVLYTQVRPGLTGLWQVSGRNDLSYRRRVAIDAVYCRAKSVSLDLKILGLTVPAVLSRRGSS